MNDLEYLHQISATNRPAPSGGIGGGLAGILKSKIFKFAVIGVVLIIFFSVMTSLLSQVSSKEKDSLVKINLRMNNISAMITTYNPSVKSSRLRSMAVSLAGILSDTTRDLYGILTTKYEYKDGAVDKAVQEEEGQRLAEAEATLERAKLNGVLDRAFLHQLNYEVALLLSLESEAMARADDETVKAILQTSTDNLNILYGELSSYSDSTN